MTTRWHLYLTAGLLLLLAGCVGPIAACSGSLAPPTPTRAAPVATPVPNVEGLRELGLAYWDTFNEYDVEGLLAFLELSYRTEREDGLRSEIRLLKTFRVKLGVLVESEPVLTGPGVAEMYMRLKEPLGTRSVLMRFQRTGAEWLITYAQTAKGE